ncbi:hypothetical protein [Nodosilinea sp. E11]|uniref:hypothetical protein n=1 Tax=Nodosilinea sp. E11 TaxID=3037479 RepID=UPI0029346FCD|nr:hypothetical protein [Nodosilinea sp. E11]WOD37130.1 hypothetical protein RRF56_01320 [Nodosilinea sp. E11]
MNIEKTSVGYEALAEREHFVFPGGTVAYRKISDTWAEPLVEGAGKPMTPSDPVYRVAV